MIERDDPLSPTEPVESPPESPANSVPLRNAGQRLAAAFRASRTRQLPALHSSFQANLEALRQDRLIRVGLLPPKPPAAKRPPSATLPSTAPTLSAIGFGPSMVIRFHQLGIATAADLAAADPTELRAGLGDITRLIDVDVWIASAQKACADAI